MATKLVYRIVGCANNVYVELFGYGKLDLARGTVEVGLPRAAATLTFDPLLVLPSALAWLLVLPRAIPKKETIAVHVAVLVFDDRGRDAGECRLVFALGRSGDAISLDGEIAECSVRFAVGDTVGKLGEVRTSVMAGPAGTVATSTAEMGSARGHTYSVVSVARVGMTMPGDPSPSDLMTTWRIAGRGTAQRLVGSKSPR